MPVGHQQSDPWALWRNYDMTLCDIALYNKYSIEAPILKSFPEITMPQS